MTTCTPLVMPARRPEPVPPAPTLHPDIVRDPMTSILYWNRPCSGTCLVWVPRHLTACRQHAEPGEP